MAGRDLQTIFISGEPTNAERLSEAKMVEEEAKAHEISRYQMAQGIVSGLFSGDGASDPNAYTKAAGMAAPFSLKLAMELNTKAGEMKKSDADIAEKNFKLAQEEKQKQLGILASAGPGSYRKAMNQYVEAGGRLPSWYSGTWEEDKPYVEQLAKSGMTALQQAELVGHQANLAMTHERLEETKKEHELKAAIAKDELERKKRRDQALEDYRHSEGIRKDRATAAKQQGRQASQEVTAIKHVQTVTEELIRRRDDFSEIDPSSVPAIVKMATTRAIKQQWEQGETRSLDEIVQETLGDVIDELPTSKKSWFGFSGGKKTLSTGGSSEGKVKPSADKGSTPKGQAPQSAIDYLKSHPELKEQFKQKYGYVPD